MSEGAETLSFSFYQLVNREMLLGCTYGKKSRTDFTDGSAKGGIYIGSSGFTTYQLHWHLADNVISMSLCFLTHLKKWRLPDPPHKAVIMIKWEHCGKEYILIILFSLSMVIFKIKEYL